MPEDVFHDARPVRHARPSGGVALPGLLAALLLLGRGGQLVNSPASMGGPMNFDLSNPLGALSLLCGAAVLMLLPRAWQRAGWTLGGIAAAVPTLWNLWRFPPFSDGASYAAYVGVPDPSEWGADAAWTMLGLSPLAFALVVAGPSWPRRRWLSLGSAALATVAACWAFEGFCGAWWEVADLDRCRLLVTVPCGALVALALRYTPATRRTNRRRIRVRAAGPVSRPAVAGEHRLIGTTLRRASTLPGNGIVLGSPRRPASRLARHPGRGGLALQRPRWTSWDHERSPSAHPRWPAGIAWMNPVHSLLDEAGLPWRPTRAALVRHYGVRPHEAYRWDVIEVGTARPIVDGLLWPVSAQASPRYAPFLPVTRFTGDAWFGTDARDNLRRAAERIVGRLGPAIVGQRYNTVRCEWTAGAAAIRLTAWPPGLQSGRTVNPAHDREPRLRTACLLEIETGFRLEATADERAWLDGFVPIASVDGDRRMTPVGIRTLSPPESELEFIREPPADVERIFGRVGRSADGGALIFCHTQLYLIPSAQLLGFRVGRLLPAKGGGGSWLEAECRTGYAEVPTKRVVVARAGGPEDLNDLAAALSAALDRPFELEEPSYDV